MLNTLTLLPAYGKKYKTMQDAITAWNSGKDFKAWELNCYCSIRDILYFKQNMYYAYLVVGSEKHRVI